MFRKCSTFLAALILVTSMLGACTPIALQPASTPASEPATEEPAVTSAPTEAEPTAASEEATGAPADPTRLILATTTSTENSGLLAYILPDFEEQTGINVDVVAVGTGQALKLGEDGNADVVLVHARSLEDAFVAAGYGVNRKDVMYNDFVIVGPESDPADIAGMDDAAASLAQIAEAGATFVSRGDESGTHVKENEVWEKAGVTPEGDWYVSAGQGMGQVLTMTDQMQGYTLSDRATYLALTQEGLELEVLVQGDPMLFNPYGVIAVNPERYPDINYEGAMKFVDWITSVPTQELIQSFGVEEFGEPLFTPDSEEWRAQED